MNEVLERLSRYGVVPVVVINDADKAKPLGNALCKGGLFCAEVTFRTAAAEESIRIISENFPEIDPQKRSVIEQIVAMQVAWMEEFAKEYPHMASNARSIHTSQDEIWNTSYETYLRGEISTYSDKMLQLYGAYVVEYARADKNLTYAIMENSALLYGYENLEAAENFLEK